MSLSLRPTLRLQTCVLRPLRASDASSLRAAADDPQVVRFMRDRFPHPYTESHAQAWLRIAKAEGLPREEGDVDSSDNNSNNNNDPSALPYPFVLAICLPTPDETCIGCIGLEPVGGGDPTERYTHELGYWIGRPYWGRGIVKEAARAFTRWALSHPNHEGPPDKQYALERITAIVVAENAASCHVLETIGFVREGVSRRAFVKQGVISDLVQYGLLRSDLK